MELRRNLLLFGVPLLRLRHQRVDFFDPRLDPFGGDYWLWFWKQYHAAREAGIEKRVLLSREME